MSLRRRFTVLAALAVTATVLVVGLGLYFVFAHQLQAQLDDRLRARASVPAGFSVSGQRFDPDVARVFVRQAPDAVFAMGIDPQGGVVFRTPNADQLVIDVPDSERAAALAGQDQFVTVDAGGTDYRLLLTRPPKITVSSQRLAAGGVTQAQLDSSVLVVGESMQAVDDALRPLRYILAGAAGAALLLGAATGGLAARRALRPVTRLSEAVDHIGHGGDLARRLPAPRTRDEVAVLSDGFNASLDRIETAYRELETLLEGQRRFVADASHELRTPLTTLRSDIDLLRRHPEMPGADRAALVERSLAEVERMSRLCGDLLTLARSDARAVTVEPVDWDLLAAEAASEVRRLCAPREVSVSLAPLGTGLTDADAVLRVVRVLAENVARHTPPQAHVTLEVRPDGSDAVLAVADDGPGVDPALLPSVFDRFVRGDPARSGPGTGLGLSIARGLVEAHGGSVAAAGVRPHGLRVEVRLPLRAAGAG